MTRHPDSDPSNADLGRRIDRPRMRLGSQASEAKEDRRALNQRYVSAMIYKANRDADDRRFGAIEST